MEVVSSHQSKPNCLTSIIVSYEARDSLGFVTIQTVIRNGEVVATERFIGNGRELKALSLLIQASLELLSPAEFDPNSLQGSVLGKIEPFNDEPEFDEYPYLEVGEFLSGLVRIALKYDDPEIDNDFYTSNFINGVFIDLTSSEASLLIHYLNVVIPILIKNEDS